MKKILLLSVMVLFASITVNPSLAMGQFFFFDNPLLGQAAPDFTLNTLRQKAVNLTAFRQGQPAIIFFWATWCPHCRVQLSELQNKSAELEQKGLKVVLIDLGENAKTVESFMQKKNIAFDVFLDQDSSVAEAYGVIGIPTFVFVDAQGKIRAVEHEIPADYEALLLAKEPAQ